MPSVGECHRIGACVWIRKRCQGERSPRETAIGGRDLKDVLLLRAADRVQTAVLVDEEARLDGSDLFAVVDRRGGGPRLTEIRRTLEVNPPAIVFGAGAAQDVAVGKLDRLVLDRTEDAIR